MRMLRRDECVSINLAMVLRGKSDVMLYHSSIGTLSIGTVEVDGGSAVRLGDCTE